MAESITPQISQLLEGTITQIEPGELLENITEEQLSYLAQNLTNPETIKLLLTFATANNRKAQEILGTLEKPAGRSVIADIFIESGNKAALEVCLRAGHKPQNIYQQAVFYALTEQRLELEKFDPDYKLLAEAFTNADKALQRRIMYVLRKAGRADVFRKLVIFEDAKKQKLFSEGRKYFSLKEKIEQLKVDEQWQELWKLVAKVSPDWSMLILAELSKAGWQPAKSEDKTLFEKLAILAQKYAGLSGIEFIANSRISTKTEVVQTEYIYDDNISSSGKYAASFQEFGNFKVLDIEKQEVIFDYALAVSQTETEIAVFSLTSDSSGILTEFENYITSGLYPGYIRNCGESWVWFSTLCKVIWVSRKQANQSNFKIECIRLYENPAQVLVTQNGEWLIIKYEANKYETSEYEWLEIVNVESKQIVSKSASFAWRTITEFAVSANGKVLAMVLNRGLIQLYKLPEFEPIEETEIWQQDVKNLVFSADIKLLVIGQPVLQIWDVENDTLASDFFSSETKTVYGNIIFRPDGEALVFDSGQRKLELLTKAGQTITLCNTANWIRGIAFSSDSRLLRMLDDEGNLITWSSLPIYLYTLPVERGEYADFLELQQLTARKDLPRDERLWLKFIELCHSLKWRYDIEIDFLPEIIPAHSDIELEEPG